MKAEIITADSVLDHVRALVLTIDGSGRIEAAHGGAGGFLGFRTQQFVGHHVLEFVAPTEQDALASYFVQFAEGPIRTVPMPMPFHTRVVAADGLEHDLDVIPTGRRDATGELCGWVVVLVPLALEASSAQSLDAELSGRPRSEVRRLLCEELGYDNDWGLLFWFYVALSSGTPHVNAPSGREQIGAVLQAAIDDGWAPWRESAVPTHRPREQVIEVTEHVPPSIRAALDPLCAGRREQRVSCVPVRLGADLVGVFLQIGLVPPEDRFAVTTNVDQRIDRLIDVTQMLEERWRDQDRLVVAATRDSLTGVANRDAFRDALDSASGPVTVLYVDVDRFKSVNDRWGHAIGDRVLTAIARRISEAVRPTDVVARFGGDEFVVLLLDVDPATAGAIGQRIVGHAAEPLGWGFGPESVTVSVGLAPDDGVTDVVDAADRAMLRAKREGRARLVTA